MARAGPASPPCIRERKAEQLVFAGWHMTQRAGFQNVNARSQQSYMRFPEGFFIFNVAEANVV